MASAKKGNMNIQITMELPRMGIIEHMIKNENEILYLCPAINVHLQLASYK
jgi:hypothetical protein